MKKTIILILLLVFMRANTYCHKSVQYDGLHCVSYTESSSVPTTRDNNLTTALLPIMPSNVLALPERDNTKSTKYSQAYDVDNFDDTVPFRPTPEEKKEYKVVQRGTIEDASPTYGDCLMELVSNDGGKTGHIVLNFKEARRYNGFVNENGERKKVPMKKFTSYALNLDTLKKVNVHSYDIITGKTNVYIEYNVTGSTKIFSRHVRDNEESAVVRNDSNERNMDIKVSEKAFNSLRDFVGDLIPYVEVDRETDLYDILPFIW